VLLGGAYRALASAPKSKVLAKAVAFQLILFAAHAKLPRENPAGLREGNGARLEAGQVNFRRFINKLYRLDHDNDC
jgi:hypothetical protein